MLDNKQQEVINRIKAGKNVLVCGSAGTGKSYIISQLRKIFKNNKNIAITSTTGISAVLLNGRTVHSFCGVGILDKPIKFYIDHLTRSGSNSGERIRTTDILVMDEFSMFSAYSFDKLIAIINGVRERAKLKSIQYVFFGDPKQLPPVYKLYEREESKKKYLFESLFFNFIFDKKDIFLLEKNYRQIEPVYARDLDYIGIGKFNELTLKRLEERISPKNINSDTVHLYGSNREVNEHNDYRYNKINEKEYTYNFFDMYEAKEDVSFSKVQELKEFLKKNSRFQEKTKLKKGCFMMCLSNVSVETGWANGTCCYVTDIIYGFPLMCKNKDKHFSYKPGEKNLEVILFDTDFFYFKDITMDMVEDYFGCVKRIGVPLTMAWARTVHKSQGSQFEQVYIESNTIKNFGQAYVALSRVTSLEGLKISTIPIISADEKAIDFLNSITN